MPVLHCESSQTGSVAAINQYLNTRHVTFRSYSILSKGLSCLRYYCHVIVFDACKILTIRNAVFNVPNLIDNTKHLFSGTSI